MNPQPKPYREGNDPESSEERLEEQDSAERISKPPTEESSRAAGGAPDDIPETAFLVIVPQVGPVEAHVNLPPAFPRKHDANLRDVRDACRQLYDDAVITMTSKGAAEEMAKTLSQLAQAQMRAMSIQQRMES